MKNFDPNSHFILFANCLPVKGASRSLICDLQNEKYHYIPNDLYDLLQETRNTKFVELYNLFEDDDKKIIEEYIEFLLKNNLGFFDSDPVIFPEMSLEWDTPAEITNSIIDIDATEMAQIDYAELFRQLSDLNCSCVQIRSFSQLDSSTLEGLLNYTLDSRINEIRLFLEYNPEIDNTIQERLLTKHKRIYEVIYFGSPENKVVMNADVRFIHMDLSNLGVGDCGQICSGLFSVNIPHFTESINFNSCLNKKISIDIHGEIKNCPSQVNSFGNINNMTLKEALKNKDFLKLWKVKKDDIQICKDCEYRYICTDCRIFITDENNPLSKPSKCTYDPYTTTWN